MVSGGYRKPTNPAPASGPGRLSKRTDGGPGQKLMVASGQPYGDRQGLLDQEKTAAMSQSPSVTPAAIPQQAPAAAGGPQMPVTPFGAPSQRPNEPVTHGVDIGPGGGASVLPVQSQPTYQSMGPMSQMLAQLSAKDQSGALAQLYQSARASGV